MAGDLISSVFFDGVFKYIILSEKRMYYILRTIGRIIATMVVFLLYTKRVLYLEMNDFRINFKLKLWNVLCAILLPAFVILIFIIISAAIDTIGAGAIEEMLFRGYIMKFLESRWNKYIEIIAPSFIFSLSHIPSMQYFDIVGILLLIISGTLVGIMFSLVVYKSNSITGSALIHSVCNFLMITDIIHFIADKAPKDPSIFNIKLTTDNVLITGGGFCVEASIIHDNRKKYKYYLVNIIVVLAIHLVFIKFVVQKFCSLSK